MHVNSINRKDIQPNFKTACKVQRVIVNGKGVGQKNIDLVYDVADTLSQSMYNGTLSASVKAKVAEIFEDFASNHTVNAARTAEPKYKQVVVMLTAHDAQQYYNTCAAKEPSDVKTWTLKHLLEINGKKRIVISAEKKEGKITITDINHYKE